jgi:hypothetical protein
MESLESLECERIRMKSLESLECMSFRLERLECRSESSFIVANQSSSPTDFSKKATLRMYEQRHSNLILHRLFQ